MKIFFGLFHPIDSPRTEEVVEAYPKRWTHHVIIHDRHEVDAKLLDWITEAYEFAAKK